MHAALIISHWKKLKGYRNTDQAKLSSDATSRPTGEVQHILDGGALLHRIPWPKGSVTHQDLCALYCGYVGK